MSLSKDVAHSRAGDDFQRAPTHPNSEGNLCMGGREGGREGRTERERGREGGREGGRDGGREGGMEGGREGGMEGGRSRVRLQIHTYPTPFAVQQTQTHTHTHTHTHTQTHSLTKILPSPDVHLRVIFPNVYKPLSVHNKQASSYHRCPAGDSRRNHACMWPLDPGWTLLYMYKTTGNKRSSTCALALHDC